MQKVSYQAGRRGQWPSFEARLWGWRGKTEQVGEMLEPGRWHLHLHIPCRPPNLPTRGGRKGMDGIWAQEHQAQPLSFLLHQYHCWQNPPSYPVWESFLTQTHNSRVPSQRPFLNPPSLCLSARGLSIANISFLPK